MDNPYAAPETDVAAPFKDGDTRFAHLDDKAQRKLYYRSSNVSAIAVLLILGSWITTADVLATYKQGENNIFTIGVVAASGLSIITSVGLIMRTQWGKILGIISCIVMLIGTPIGIIVGTCGLFGAPEIFGKDRVKHKELKAEFKKRKAAAKAAKRQAKLG